MTFMQILRNLSSKDWIRGFSVVLVASSTWILHFLTEFYVLTNHQLPLSYILFHFSFLPVGSIIGIFVISKIHIKYLYGYLPPVLWIIHLVFVNFSLTPEVIMALLSLAGLFIGISFPGYFVVLKNLKIPIQFNGRFSSFSTIGNAFIIFLTAIFLGLDAILPLSVLFLLNFVATIYVIPEVSKLEYSPRKPIRYQRFFADKTKFPSSLFNFFWGFFFVISYYAPLVLIKQSLGGDTMNTTQFNYQLGIFVAIMFATIMLGSLGIGYLIDWIGRKRTILSGYYIYSILFVFLSFTNTEQFLLAYWSYRITAIVIGLGFMMSITGGIVIFLEIVDQDRYVENIFFNFSFAGIAMVLGAVIVELLINLLTSLIVVLIFALFTATFVTFQLKEPLPSKEELEWREAIKYLLFLKSSGVVLYSQQLQEGPEGTDEVLIGGAVVAISSIVQEIVKNEDSLKEIKQEHYSILIEQVDDLLLVGIATKELKNLRNRMQDLVDDFHLFFAEVLENWNGDIDLFLPTKQLIARHFDT